jgi:hypothetical protein
MALPPAHSMLLSLLVVLTLTLVSAVALCATARATHRIPNPWGWGLTLLLSAVAVALLRLWLGWSEAVATACIGVMAVLPVLATAAGWRRRNRARDDTV